MQMVIIGTNQNPQHCSRTNYLSIIPTEPEELKVVIQLNYCQSFTQRPDFTMEVLHTSDLRHQFSHRRLAQW